MHLGRMWLSAVARDRRTWNYCFSGSSETAGGDFITFQPRFLASFVGVLSVTGPGLSLRKSRVALSFVYSIREKLKPQSKKCKRARRNPGVTTPLGRLVLPGLAAVQGCPSWSDLGSKCTVVLPT